MREASDTGGCSAPDLVACAERNKCGPFGLFVGKKQKCQCNNKAYVELISALYTCIQIHMCYMHIHVYTHTIVDRWIKEAMDNISTSSQSLSPKNICNYMQLPPKIIYMSGGQGTRTGRGEMKSCQPWINYANLHDKIFGRNCLLGLHEMNPRN